MSEIKLIASDLDGTLLLHGAQKCNPELFPLIEELTERGIYFVAASGRQYLNLQRLFAPVKEKITYLSENGSLVMHMDQVLLKRQFEDDLALDICHTILDHPDCEIVISGERTSYLIPKRDSFVTHVRDEVGNHVTVIDAPERIEEAQQAATDSFQKKFKDARCLIVTSGNRWVDFAPPGTGNGEALEKIGENLGILPEEMAAFGDNENDRTMLQFVGHPYLMEHCNPTMEDVRAKRCRKVEDSLREILDGIS